MSTHNPLEHDERSASENAGYRWGFLFVVYALLLDVMYRGGVRHEAPWDLLALVVFGGAFSTAWQARHKILTRGWAINAALLTCLTGVLAAILVLAVSRWVR